MFSKEKSIWEKNFSNKKFTKYEVSMKMEKKIWNVFSIQSLHRVEWGLFRWPKKTTKLDYVRRPNYIAETCKMTKFVRTVSLNWLSLTKIKVYIPPDLIMIRFTVLLFSQVTKVFLSSLFGHLTKSNSVILFSVIWTSLNRIFTVLKNQFVWY